MEEGQISKLEETPKWPSLYGLAKVVRVPTSQARQAGARIALERAKHVRQFGALTSEILIEIGKYYRLNSIDINISSFVG